MKRVNLYLKGELLEKLEAFANENGLTLAQSIKFLLSKALKEVGRKNEV